jgi:type IV pilus assembly protein PilC
MYYLVIVTLTLVPLGVGLALALTVMERSRQAALLWLLAVITRRRLPLVSELDALSEGLLTCDRGQASQLAEQVRAGTSLPQALSTASAARGVVSDDAVVMAHVGERSDRLGEALAAEAKRLTHVRNAALSSPSSPSLMLVYLIAVLFVIPVILTGLMVFIVPKYQRIFSDSGISLPPVTLKLIEWSGVFAISWLSTLASVLIAAILGVILFFLGRVYGWSFRRPRWLVPRGRTARASLALRALAVPAAAARPLTDALDVLATVPRHRRDRGRFERLRERHRAGESLWGALAAEGVISRRETELLAAAERAGNLTWALQLLADRIDARRQHRIAALIEVAQPLIVLALGALVLFICAGMFLPLVELIELEATN